MKKTKVKDNRGITLIALVITIIVLLILAGISIAMLTGENGILTQANKTKIDESHGAVKEGILLEYGDYKIDAVANNVEKTFIKFLSDKAVIADNVVDVEKLIGKKLELGNFKCFEELSISLTRDSSGLFLIFLA